MRVVAGSIVTIPTASSQRRALIISITLAALSNLDGNSAKATASSCQGMSQDSRAPPISAGALGNALIRRADTGAPLDLRPASEGGNRW